MLVPSVTMPRQSWLLSTVLVIACLSCVSARLAVMSIDLGGEFMKIAIVKPGVPMEIVLNKDSARKTLTMVAFRDGERHFASQAQSTAVKFPPKAICYLNHVIGRQFDDPQVELYRQRFPHFSLIKDEERGTVLFKTDDESTYTPEELLGMILEKAREYAQAFAEQEIKDAVITVPAFYNQAERRAILMAANLVGINVLQLMTDNAAVALNYGVFRRKNFNTTMQYYMFYDMGATSTTATIVGYNVVKTKENGYTETNPQLTVKGVGFDRTLGGLEFTLRLRNHLATVFDGQKKTTLKVRDNARSMAKLFKEAERVKKVLSANSDHTAQIEGLLDEKDFRAPVKRDELEEMTSDLLARVTKPVEEALKVSEITLPEISEVILMGAATRMPKVQELLVKFLGRSDLGKSINTDEAAAMGGVYQAAYLGKGFKVKKFGVRDANIYPINVEFEKQKSEDSDSKDAEGPAKSIKRTLFGRMNPYPQKKVMTFNKHSRDFGFKVLYSSLDFLTEEEKKSFVPPLISEYMLVGVEDALTKNKDTEHKGIKAHFRMDDNGIVSLDKVESVFEKNSSKEAEGEKSAWSKLGSAIGGLFGGSTGDEDTKVEESSEEETTEEQGEKKEEEPEEEKKKPEADKKAEEKTENEGGDAKKDGKEKKKDKKESTGKADDSKDSTSGKNATKDEEVKPKLTTVKEEIKTQMAVKDLPDMATEVVKKAKKRLSDMRAADKEKADMEKAKNELEAFIFDFSDKARDEDTAYYKCASEGERTKLATQLEETSDWLYEQGDDTKKADYVGKLQALTANTKPVMKRAREMEERPKALEALRSALNQTNVFFDTVKNMTDIEDPIFTAVEMTTLGKLINDSRDWRDKQVAAQKKLLAHEDPVLLAEDIAQKIGDLDREMRYLINKAKNFKPKPKPKPKDDTKANSTKKTTAEKKKKKVVGEEDGTTTTTTDTPTTDSTQEEAPPAASEEKEEEGGEKDEEEEEITQDAAPSTTGDDTTTKQPETTTTEEDKDADDDDATATPKPETHEEL